MKYETPYRNGGTRGADDQPLSASAHDPNVELAQETIDGDYLVNRAELETDEMCTVV